METDPVSKILCSAENIRWSTSSRNPVTLIVCLYFTVTSLIICVSLFQFLFDSLYFRAYFGILFVFILYAANSFQSLKFQSVYLKCLLILWYLYFFVDLLSIYSTGGRNVFFQAFSVLFVIYTGSINAFLRVVLCILISVDVFLTF